MPQIMIPEPWRNDVCAILETEDRELIEWTTDAVRRYEADAAAVKSLAGGTDPAWLYEVYQSFRTFLAPSQSKGCPINMATPPGETYEFYFGFLRTSFYGKLLLRPDRKRMVIFSAHRPLKGKLSCE